MSLNVHLAILHMVITIGKTTATYGTHREFPLLGVQILDL